MVQQHLHKYILHTLRHFTGIHQQSGTINDQWCGWRSRCLPLEAPAVCPQQTDMGEKHTFVDALLTMLLSVLVQIFLFSRGSVQLIFLIRKSSKDLLKT